jgi:hypothetical protein
MSFFHKTDPKDYQLHSTSNATAKTDKPTGGMAGGKQAEGGAKMQGQGQAATAGKKSVAGKRIKTASDRMVKQLLGELYADKEYLEQLMNDKGNFLHTFNPQLDLYETKNNAPFKRLC